MRTGILALTALVTVSSVLSGQVGRRPPTTGGRTTPQPGAAVPLPPEVPEVARALALKRSRWSGETYGMISAIRTPVADAGGVVTSTGYGGGTHADYRHTPFFSSSFDFTYATLGRSGTSSTVEFGSRYSPAPLDQKARPFFDVRAAYMMLWDQSPTGNPGAIQAGLSQQSRYSRGLGGIAGTGIDYRLTNSFSVISEVSAMRSRMALNQNNGPAELGAASKFWMTSFRYTIGLKYNPTSALHLAQNPRQ